MGYIKNSYSMITLVCGNHGENESIEMQVKIGPNSPFYACPKYYEENREKGERMCVNRVSSVDYEKALAHLTDKILEAGEDGTILDLTNYEWKKNGIHYKVLSYKPDRIVVKALNLKAINQ